MANASTTHIETAAPLRVVLMTPYGIDNGGIRHLAAVARTRGAAVRTIFLKRWRNNNISLPTEREIRLFLDLVTDFSPDLVGIGFGSPYFKPVRDLTERLRTCTKAPIILGGIHPTLMPEACIPWCDYLCIGEGEAAFDELLARMQRGESVRDVRNIWVNHGGKIIRNPVRPLIADLDTVPFRDFTDEGKFFIDDNRVQPGDPLRGASVLRVHASRGCPFHCAFCYNSSLRAVYGSRGNYYRRRSAGNVLREIHAARRILPRINRIKFDDDSFVHSRTWIDEFTRRYPDEVGLTFDLMLNPQAISEDTLWKLKRAGLDNVQIGIQSASAEESEGLYERRDPNRSVRRFSRLNRLLKLDVVYDVIFDNPLAGPTDKDQLLDLLLRLDQPFKLYLYSLTLFPQSSVTRTMLREGMITPADVEGEATKSFHQFRLSFDWPRSAEDEFYISLTILIAKHFVPRRLIRRLRGSAYLRRRPAMLKAAAQAANLVKMAAIGFTMLRRGDLSMVKIREYASFKRMIFQ
ncbi:cobalamin-dependent protein [bacterium]|nr:cobalamin-dependent protein [candidate division CSSED10-310 bacterium]